MTSLNRSDDSIRAMSVGNNTPSSINADVRVNSLARLRGTPAWPKLLAIHGLLRKGESRNEMNIPFKGVDYIEETIESFIDKYAYTGVGPLDEAENNERLKIRSFERRPWKEWSERPREYFTEMKEVSVTRDDLREAAIAYMNANGYQFGLSPINFEESVQRMRKGTNLGMPYLTSSPDAWNGPIFREYLSKAKRVLSGKSYRFEPFFMFWRIQQGKRGDINKHRVVWGADHVETIAMLPFLYPFIDNNAQAPGVRAFLGVEKYVELFGEMKRSAPKDYVWISGDVSAKDQSTAPLHVEVGFDIWQQIVPDVSRVRDLLSEYYVTGELITPDGIYKGTHGRPSGIVPTGLFNTFDMMAAVSLFWISNGLDIKDLIAEFHGDDFVFACPQNLVDDVWPFMQKCGWSVNPSKSMISQESFNYLQRYWTPSVDGYYPMSRVMARLAYSERTAVSYTYEKGDKVSKVEADKRMLMLQIYSRLENARYHPNFTDLVEFVGKLDRYQLSPEVIGSRWKLREVLTPYTIGTQDKDVGLEATATYQAVARLRSEGKLQTVPA